MKINLKHISWALIILGIYLRLTDLTFPDLTTDEAQAAFGTSPAWTPLGMMILRGAQGIFGHELIVIRMVSALFGIAFLPLFYYLCRLYSDKRISLFAVAIAAIFPTHILFSRLSYLSIQLCLAWTLTLYFFLRARKEPSAKWLSMLYISSVVATMMKTQGLLLPVFLVVGMLIENLRKADRNKSIEIVLTLIISLIPVFFYILSHPGVFATVFQYGGNMYGVSEPGNRIFDLVITWWRFLSIFLIAIAFSLSAYRKLNWPFWITIGTGILTGIVLGPSHEYYATYLVLFALPISISLLQIKPIYRNLSVGALTVITILILAPQSLLRTPWMPVHYQEDPYWNTHTEAVNEVLKDEEVITVLGGPGHHIRWYLDPKVLVGDNMEKPYKTDYVLVLRDSDLAKSLGKIVYEDERVSIAVLP
jgi:4-amino-4-deoxy-L-arabinose transferase-like glycosyltransferase